jgi:hypothetical protein
MDSQTGTVYPLAPGETFLDLARRLAPDDPLKRTHIEISRDLVALDKDPDEACPKCHGTGAMPRGEHSRRFKPCDCTRL